VHSLAAGLLLDPSELHFFLDIGYRHFDRLTCPIGRDLGSKKYKLDCSCDVDNPQNMTFWVYRDHWIGPIDAFFKYFSKPQ
jgi:alpha 1,2-mannosyltransferase